MKLIEILPIGKENKKTRNVLMKESNIKDVEEFKKQLAEIKKQYIVIFDDGYYLPSNENEYNNFINKTNEQIKYYTKLKEMANKEMEEKEYMYEAYITTLKNVRKHNNADKLKVGECFGNQVVVDLSYQEGDIGIYFPTDGKLGKEFAEVNNLLRKKDENGNNIGGYLEPDKRNIKAIKLRGEKSDGLFLPVKSLEQFCDISKLNVGDRITTLNGTLICEKYIPRTNKRTTNNNKVSKKKKKIVEFPLFAEHVDTEQLDYNLDEFKQGDTVYLTIKMHGTSQRTGLLPKESNKNILSKLKNKYFKTKYDTVTGTRRVVIDSFEKDTGFYGNDKFREQWHKFFKERLQKGEEVYYEVVGYVNKNTPIMPDGNNKKIQDKEFIKKYGDTTRFSYGCEQGFCQAYVYRMTMTNEDGYVVEYPWELVKTRCEEMGIPTVLEVDKFLFTTKEDLLERVNKYLDIPDTIGKTHIAEGVVARIDNRKTFKAFKKKGFYFKVLEGIIKDTAESPDMEEIQE